jgi:hypothetical protein
MLPVQRAKDLARRIVETRAKQAKLSSAHITATIAIIEQRRSRMLAFIERQNDAAWWEANFSHHSVAAAWSNLLSAACPEPLSPQCATLARYLDASMGELSFVGPVSR